MSLLAKIRICGGLLLALLIFNSCEESGPFGLNSDDVAPIEFFSDNISVSSSVVLLDSVRTNSLGRLFVGAASNSTYGSTTAEGFTRMSFNRFLFPSLSENTILDSAKFNFRVNYLYDDANENRTFGFDVYELADELKDTTYVNYNRLDRNNTLVAQGEVEVTVLDSTYSVDLNPTWANLIFEGIRTDDDNFADQGTFDEFINGFSIQSTANTTNVFGLSHGSNLQMIFYISEPRDDGSGDFNNFTITLDGNNQVHFYHTNADRSGTDFSSILDRKIEYDQLNKRFIQSGNGIVTKIDLSGLEGFATNNPGVIVNQAEISIGPIDELDNSLDVPDALFLFITDETNALIPDRETFRAIQQDGTNVLDRGFPALLIYDSETRTYSSSITTYVQSYVTGEFRRDDIFLFPVDMTASINGFTFDPGNIEIKIFYSELR